MNNSFVMPETNDSMFVTYNGIGPGSGGGKELVAPFDPDRPVVFSTDLPDATVSVNPDGEIVNNQ